MKKEKVINILTIVIVSLMINGITTYATSYLYNSDEVKYNNQSSRLSSTNVQGALEELYYGSVNYAQIRDQIFDTMYPVGSVYISTTLTNATQVTEKFGGTWEAYGQGRTIIGAGTGTDTNNASKSFTVNSTGGEYTHKLTITEMPSHNHSLQSISGYDDKNFINGDGKFHIQNSDTTVGFSSAVNAAYYYGTTYGTTGGDSTHNNIQPYITVYMYKRTA